MLEFPKFDKSFEMHIDASNFVIYGVLMQDGRPLAYVSKKFNGYQMRWPTFKKELFAIVHCFKMWQYYMGLYKTKVYKHYFH